MAASIGRSDPALLSSTSTSYGKASKYARAQAQRPQVTTSVRDTKRTSHACNRCRLLRVKCSGGEICTKCCSDRATCVYGDRKREKDKKVLKKSLAHIAVLEEEKHRLLTTLQHIASSSNLLTHQQRDIEETLQNVSTKHLLDESDEFATQSTPGTYTSHSDVWDRRWDTHNTEDRRQLHGEDTTASSIGSPGRQDELMRAIDLDHATGVLGFVGKMSEVTWLQRIKQYLSDQLGAIDNAHLLAIDGRLVSSNDLSYFMEDENLLAIDEDHVDALQRPPLKVAVILAETYFHAVQSAFQFIQREDFMDFLTQSSQHNTISSWAYRRWLAIANIVWAIASKWLQISKLEVTGFCEHHLVYYARARALGLDHRVMFDFPDVNKIEAFGVLAFYLMVNGSIARAYGILGHATRYGAALGLHLKVSDPIITIPERLQRARTWFSLYSLETLMVELTGRPASIANATITLDCSIIQQDQGEYAEPSIQLNNELHLVPTRRTWLDILNESRESSQMMTGSIIPWNKYAVIGQVATPEYFLYRVRLCQLSDKIEKQLYVSAEDLPWGHIQSRISELQTELRHWLEALPTGLALQSSAPNSQDPRPKVELRLYYHSVQMILYRPCLCSIRIEGQSLRSQDFDSSSARAGVLAAMSMLSTMPDNPSAHEIYQLLPFWALLHYVVQAASMLLLELCLDSKHFPHDDREVGRHLRKAMEYLWCLTQKSLSAYRAWRIIMGLLTRLQSQKKLLIAGLPREAVQPLGWTARDEASVQLALNSN